MACTTLARMMQYVSCMLNKGNSEEEKIFLAEFTEGTEKFQYTGLRSAYISAISVCSHALLKAATQGAAVREFLCFWVAGVALFG